MSAQLTKVFVPAPVAVPRGAEWVAALAQAGQKLWQVLEEVGRSRARRELRTLAEQHAHQPEFAQTLRDAMNSAHLHRDSNH